MLTLEKVGEAIHTRRILILMAEIPYIKLAQESVSELPETTKKIGSAVL